MVDAHAMFWVVAILGLSWVVMMYFVFERMKWRHPEQYEALGEPDLFWNNSMKSSTAALRFLVRRDHKGLNDRGFSLLCDSTLLVLAAFAVVFFGLFFWRLSGGT